MVPDSVLAADTIYGATPLENLRVVPVELQVRELPAALDGMRIAALGGFALGRWADDATVARAAVEAAVSARPDAVALLGGYAATPAGVAELPAILAPLRGIPTIAVLGRRDDPDPGARPDSVETPVAAALRSAGVEVLRDGRVRVARGGDSVFIAGVDPRLLDQPEWKQAEDLVGTGTATVLLAADPTVLGAVARSSRDVPLLLAGGTSCGQVTAPGELSLGTLRSETLAGATLPQAERAFRVGGSTMLVTCGVGNSYIPVRFGSPPEVLLVTLRNAGATAGDDGAPVTPASLPPGP